MSATGRSISYRKYKLPITQPSQYRYAKLQLEWHRISGRPDIRPFLISGIRPDIRFRLPDIQLAGYPASKTLHGIFFLQNLGLH